jgi:predicted dehydrogenase
MEKRKIKYGIVGCGRIAPNHVTAVLANADTIEIKAICDINPDQMGALLTHIPDQQKSNVHQYTDYSEMLKREELELVAVCTESGKHASIGLDVINSKRSVVIEKPMALSIQDADALIQAAKDNKVKLCACHQNRFNKSIQKVREALEQNRLGPLMHATAHIRWNRGKDYYTQAPWRGTWEQDGGALMNQCLHNIDLLRWMMGNGIDEVFAYTKNILHDYIEAEDLGLALIKFTNGSFGMIEGTTNVFPTNLEETLYLFGQKGTIKVGGKSVNLIEEWRFGDGLDDPQQIKKEFGENPPNVYGYGHVPLYADVAKAIINDTEPYINGEDGKRALELILAIYKSAKEGKPVKFPLDVFSTMDMKGFFYHE